MKSYFLNVILLLHPSLSFGLMIGNLSADKLPAQSCFIGMVLAPVPDESGQMVTRESLCSATIIGKSTLLSCAHCFYNKDITEAYIECPGEPEKKVLSWTIPKEYKRPEVDFGYSGQSKLDLAVLQIEGEFKTTPAKLPSTSKDVTKWFEQTEKGSPPNCIACGYGDDEHGNPYNHACRSVVLNKWILGEAFSYATDPKTGKPVIKGAKVDWWDEDQLTLLFDVDQVLKNQTVIRGLNGGDSGGGLFCFEKGSPVPILMGVNSGTGTMMNEALKEKNHGISVSVAHRLTLIQQLTEKDKEATATKSPRKLEPTTPHRPSDSHGAKGVRRAPNGP